MIKWFCQESDSYRRKKRDGGIVCCAEKISDHVVTMHVLCQSIGLKEDFNINISDDDIVSIDDLADFKNKVEELLWKLFDINMSREEELIASISHQEK